MGFKVLALDLDGTLTNSKKVITPHTREALLKAQRKGVKIVLASGRPTYAIAPMADLLGITEYGGYLLAYNGGEIVEWPTKKILYKQEVPHELLPYLYESAEKNNFAIMTYHNEYAITERPNDEYVLRQALLQVMTLKPVEHFLEAVTFPVVKCMIAGEPERLANLEKEMAQQLQGRMEAYRSEPYFLELVSKGIDKGSSLEKLLHIIGISTKETIACGDGLNDIPMIRTAGLGVAMGNAGPEVLAAADYITGSNNEEGVSQVIEKFLL